MTQLYLFIALVAAALQNVYPDIRGKVLDENSKPLPYASVFLKHHPSIGTISEENGRFTVSTDTASSVTSEAIKRDTLMISMLGYETAWVPVAQLKAEKVNVLKLKESHFYLDEVVVKASKNKKKQHRNEMRALLDLIYARAANVDGPQKEDAFKIVSDIRVFKDDTPLTMSRLSGTLHEMPGMSSKGRDTARIDVEFQKDFMEPAIRNGVDNFDMTKLNRKDKKNYGSFDKKKWDKTMPHKVLWGTDVKMLMKMTYEEEKYWDSIKKDDTTLLVSYSRNRGFLGIVKDEERMTLTVDMRSFAVRSLSGTLAVHLNLPFGYKLSPAELEVLNWVNLNEDALDKFKIKKADVTVETFIERKLNGERMLPHEKSMKNTASIADRKGNGFTFKNTCEINALEYFKK